MRPPVIVCYDIFDDLRRTRVRETLAEHAIRFQQSGWLVPPDARISLRALSARLSGLVHPTDRLRLHAPCPSCARTARAHPANAAALLVPRATWTAD